MKNILSTTSLFFAFLFISSCEEPAPKKEYHEVITSQHSAFWKEGRGISFLCTSNQEEGLNKNDRTQVIYLIMQPKEEWEDISSEKEPYKFRSSFIYRIFEFKEEAEPMFSFYRLNEEFLNGMSSLPERWAKKSQIDYREQVPAFEIFQRIRQSYDWRPMDITAEEFISLSDFTSHKSANARDYHIKINRESLDFFIKPNSYKNSWGEWITTKFTHGGSCKISNNIEIKNALMQLSKNASTKKIEFEIKIKQAQEEELKKLNQENKKQLEKNKI